MFYKILSVVFALVLCSISVFAADSVEEDSFGAFVPILKTTLDEGESWLCSEHYVLYDSEVPDAVCPVCYFGVGGNLVNSKARASLIQIDPTTENAGTYLGSAELEPVNSYYDMISGVDLSPYMCYTLINSNDYTGWRYYSRFSYSPVRQAYITPNLSNLASNGNFYDWIGIWPFAPDSNYCLATYSTDINSPNSANKFTVYLNARVTDYDGNYYSDYTGFGSKIGWSFIKAMKRPITEPLQYINYWDLYRGGTYGSRYPAYNAGTQSGYMRLWQSFDIGYSVLAEAYSPAAMDEARFNMGSEWANGLSMVEVKSFVLFNGLYDVANGVYPSSYPGGGTTVGSIYPVSENEWIDTQFSDAVNNELSGTASSVTDGIDSMLDFEAGIYEDLNRYKSEIDFGNYSIPDTLAASFGWLSNKFMSFFDSVPDLRPIILFPAYLAIVVAIVHGLENAGARSSAAIIRQSNYETRSEERSTSARRFWRLMFKRSGKGG